MDIEYITSTEEMETLKSEWEDLFENAIHQSLFSEPDFCLNWYDHFGANKRWAPKGAADEQQSLRPARPFLALVRNGGRLEAALPLRSVPTRAAYMNPPDVYPAQLGSMPTMGVEGLINAHSGITSILIRRDAAASPRAVARAIAPLRWQSLNLGLVPSPSPFSAILQDALAPIARRHDTAPKKNLRIYFDGAHRDFVGQRKSLKRKIKESNKALESEFGPISLKYWNGHAAATDGLRAYMDVEDASWKASKPGGEILSRTPIVRKYYSSLLQRFAKRKQAHVWALCVGEDLAAACLCIESSGIIYSYKISHKEAYATARIRPGFVLDTKIIEFCWNRNEAFDFMSAAIPGEWRCTEEHFEAGLWIPNDRWRRLVSPMNKGFSTAPLLPSEAILAAGTWEGAIHEVASLATRL